MTAIAKKLGYGMIDADSHYYEPYDCFTRHIEEKYRSKAVHHVPHEDGLARTFIGDKPFLWRPIAFNDRVGAPGANKGMVAGDPEATESHQIPVIRPADHPEFMNNDARLALMDRQGVEANIMLPTEAALVEWELYKETPEVAFANLRSFNRFIEEDWGFSYQNRLFGVPLLSLFDIGLVVEELERVLAAGARFVHLNAGPAYGKSPADMHYDPFWARVEEAGIPVIFHIGNSGYNEMVCKNWGLPEHPSLYETGPFQQFLGLGNRPISDTMASLVLGDLFGRFPKLKVMSVEYGCSWVAPLLEEMDHATKLSRVPWSSREGLPSDIFKEHVYVTPFWEERGIDCVNILGVDHTIMGSDYPHPEGEDEPINYLDCLDGLDEEDVKLIMRDNTAKLMGLAV